MSSPALESRKSAWRDELVGASFACGQAIAVVRRECPHVASGARPSVADILPDRPRQDPNLCANDQGYDRCKAGIVVV